MLPIHGLVNLSEVLTGAFCLGFFFFYDFFLSQTVAKQSAKLI